MHLLRLTIVIARTAGAKAVYMALPLYFAIGIAAVIIFMGNGMDASDITSLLLASPAWRHSLLLGWAILTLPVARLLVEDPQTFFLRALPVPRVWLIGIVGIALGLLQFAWVVLWVRGSGVICAAIALFAVLGVQSYAIAGLRGAGEWTGLASVLFGWQLAPSAASLVLLVPAFVIGHRLAWLRAPEPKGAGRHRVWTPTASVATATAFGIAAHRDNGSAALRAFALAALAYAVTRLGLHNSPEWVGDNLLPLASALWGAACLLGGVTLARPLLRAEIELAWVLDVCGASARLRALSGIGLLAALGGLSGCVFGAALSPFTMNGAPAELTLALHLAVGGAAWAALAVALVRITTRGGGRDGGRLLIALLGSYVVATVVLLASPAFMLLSLVSSAAVVGAHATRLGTPSRVLLLRRN